MKRKVKVVKQKEITTKTSKSLKALQKKTIKKKRTWIKPKILNDKMIQKMTIDYMKRQKKGLTTLDIAQKYNISLPTLYNYLKNVKNGGK